jgi:dihydrofolate reductase
VALAQVAEVTEIEQDVDGDAFAPTLGPAWHEVAREHHRSAAGLAFSFVTYQQTPHGD